MDTNKPNSLLDSWMIMLEDDTPINKIAIPGSHDAATIGTIWCAETQRRTVKEQLTLGARYFDLRVHKKKDKYVIFHSIADGVAFDSVLNDLKEFIFNHPTEFLILDFQHFKGDSQEGTLAMLKESLGNAIVYNDSELDDVQFIRSLKLKDVRGKCLIFWGDESASNSNCTFLRNDNECTREGACLDSYYLGKIHRTDFDGLTKQAHPVYFERLKMRQEEGSDGIFVLQCQLTSKNILTGPWVTEKNKNKPMTEYVKALAQYKEIESINVIMRDFLDAQKCTDIINLNYAKGIMKLEI